MIKITSIVIHRRFLHILKCIKALVKNIFSENNIKDAEISYVFCDDNYLSNLKKKFFQTKSLN